MISEGKKPKTPDSDSLRRADHFAPVISSRGILGLEIRAKIVSSRFLFLSGSSRHNTCQKHRKRNPCVDVLLRRCSGISGHDTCQKHRIRNPRIVLIILHRLSALGAFWGPIFRPKSFQGVFGHFRAALDILCVKNTGFGFLASC